MDVVMLVVLVVLVMLVMLVTVVMVVMLVKLFASIIPFAVTPTGEKHHSSFSQAAAKLVIGDSSRFSSTMHTNAH